MEDSHSPRQSNVTSVSATTLAIITLETFPGMWINAFIVFVISTAWVKRKTLNSNEKILLLLGCSRFCFLCSSWIFSFLSILYPDYLYVHPIFQALIIITGFFNCSDLCVSTCLSVFYCIKIANFRNSCFIGLKVKIDKIVPWLLFGSQIFPMVIGILLYDITDKAQCNNATSLRNLGKLNMKMDEYFFPYYFITGLGFVTSLTAVISSALLLLFSLWRHKRNMQTNSMNSPSMDAHIKAMKSILSFLVMYSMNFITMIVTMIYSTKERKRETVLIFVFLYAFPGIHSLILIFSNPKLVKTLFSILMCVKCRVCMKKEL
ncbi:taste receptor type 2 member 40-like [Malurus melanocephalus]|uniref:taste receptor type 2 member 40-like n=1 Tax=Malurus melanocephalus TaxID=175006 RepID=UPI0025493C7C|nr:taste receptor type 2 member 40-like [Malurus melanocephalus]